MFIAARTPPALCKGTKINYSIVLVLMCAGGAIGIGMYGLNGATDFWAVKGFVFVPLIVLAVALKRIRKATQYLIWRIDNLEHRSLWFVTVSLALLTAISLPIITYVHCHRFGPLLHDELSYAVMAQIYATGRLWMPAHPLGEALVPFYVFAEPVYGSMYFPGTGLIYALAVLAGLPLWVMSGVVAGICVGLLFRLLLHSVSPAVALMTVMTLLILPHFQWFAMNIMSHMPLLMCVLIAVLGYLNWIKARTYRWLWMISGATGFALITRPLDAVLLLCPPGAAIIIELLCTGRFRQIALVLCTAVCGVAPFISLQLIINHAYTGQWTQTPHQAYVDRFMPGAGLGFNEVHSSLKPDTVLPQKIALYETFALPAMRQHQHLSDVLHWPVFLNRWNAVTYGSMITPLLWAAALPGYWLLLNRIYWPVAVAPFLLLTGLLLFPFMPTWYFTGALASHCVAIATGIQQLAVSKKSLARVCFIGVFIALGVTGIVHVPIISGRSANWFFRSPELEYMDEVIGREVKSDALIFFTFDPTVHNVHYEPVHNIDTAWPDDARVIRVHDLGRDANGRVLDYYQKHQPTRWVYSFDRTTNQLNDLGNIAAAKARMLSSDGGVK
jgi:hypothetical protein